MATLDYNEIRIKKFISYEDEPFEVIDSHVARKQMGKPTNKVKMKSLTSGRVIEITFHAADTVEEADMSQRPLTYLYYQDKKDEYWFADAENPKDRFTLPATTIGDGIRYIKENSQVNALVFTDEEGEDKIIGIKYPLKVELRVTEAPPNTRGDTATGGKKMVTLETGVTMNAPLFINEGDLVLVNIETGEYSERVEKN